MTARRGFADGSNGNTTKEWRSREERGGKIDRKEKERREKEREKRTRGTRDVGSAWYKEKERSRGRELEDERERESREKTGGGTRK